MTPGNLPPGLLQGRLECRPTTTRLSYTERNQKNMLLPKEAYIKSEFSADFKYGNGMFLKI